LLIAVSRLGDDFNDMVCVGQFVDRREQDEDKMFCSVAGKCSFAAYE